MMNFTKTYSKQFWEENIPELSGFFNDMQSLEYWTFQEEDVYPFLVFFEIQINNFRSLNIILNQENHFDSFIEILSYLKIGTFFYLIHEINKEQSSFLTSCLISCKQEKNVYEKLFIERFKLLDRYNFLPKLFNDKKINLIKMIIVD